MNAIQTDTQPANVCHARLPKTKFEIPQRVAERAATRWILGDGGCFVSTYSVGSHGYAQIGWQDGKHRQAVTAHRAAWVYAHRQQIPVGMTVDHLCKNRRCVNPAHLRLLSNFENARRTHGRDWPIGQCARGHSNDHLRQYGSRWMCSKCAEEDPKFLRQMLYLDNMDEATHHINERNQK